MNRLSLNLDIGSILNHKQLAIMKNKYFFALLLPCLFLNGCIFPEQKFERFFAWSLPRTEELVQKSADVGVTDAVVSHGNALQLALAKKYGIRTYPCLMPLESLWKKRQPGQPAPLQVMSPSQEALHKFRWVDQAEGVDLPSHHGGEPPFDISTGKYLPDVLPTRLLCLGSPAVRAMCKEYLTEMCANNDYAGIAFDYVGFMNYRRCHCQDCQDKLAEYCRKHQLTSTPLDLEEAFFQEQLVSFYHEMVEQVKSLRPEMLTFAHLYPVFLPNPLYGRLLKLDFCAETAAWYFPWPEKKILEYSRIISRYPAGVHFIGYYNTPMKNFPEKQPALVERELQTMLSGGATHLSVCGFEHVVKNPAIYDVFKRYLRHAK